MACHHISGELPLNEPSTLTRAFSLHRDTLSGTWTANSISCLTMPPTKCWCYLTIVRQHMREGHSIRVSRSIFFALLTLLACIIYELILFWKNDLTSSRIQQFAWLCIPGSLSGDRCDMITCHIDIILHTCINSEFPSPQKIRGQPWRNCHASFLRESWSKTLTGLGLMSISSTVWRGLKGQGSCDPGQPQSIHVRPLVGFWSSNGSPWGMALLSPCCWLSPAATESAFAAMAAKPGGDSIGFGA